MLHPKDVLHEQIIETLRESAFETEQLRKMPQKTMELIYNERWFQVLVPKLSGGLEYTLPQAVRLFEALAYADANVGWCVNLGAGANMFSGYLNETVSREIFDNPETCCAGSGAISGKAIKVDGGYQLTGRWKYASGADHATHFTANALLSDESGNQLLENDQPMFRSFIIPAANIINHKNWDAIGLKATSSNDFEADNVFVRDEYLFDLKNPSGFANGTVYQFPFTLLAEINMTCMITGIALHFMESYNELAKTKKPLHSNVSLAENSKAQAINNNISADFLYARISMYDRLDKIWNCYEQQQVPSESMIFDFRKSVNKAGKLSRQLIYELYPLCGLNIVSINNEMNKIWRDAAVAGQHYLLSPLYEIK